MSIETHRPAAKRRALPRSRLGRRLDTASWAAFLIWVGTAILFDVGWGWFLAGLGLVAVATQEALRVSGDRVERLWLLCGAAFLVAGLWEIAGWNWPLAPLLMILLGLGLLWQALFRRPKLRE